MALEVDWFGDFGKIWDGLKDVGMFFEEKAAATVDLLGAISRWDRGEMMDAMGRYGGAITTGLGGVGKTLEGTPGIGGILETYDAARAHALVRPITTAFLAGTRSDTAESPWGYVNFFGDEGQENWRKAWNDSQFVTFGQAATWWGSFLFMDDQEAAQRDPGTFTGRRHYTSEREAAVRASIHGVNMFDESGDADRQAFERYVREIQADPKKADEYEPSAWFKYSSGALDFGAAFIDIPFLGWAAKGTKLLRGGGKLGDAETAAAFLGRNQDTLARLDRAADDAAQAAPLVDRLRKAEQDAKATGEDAYELAAERLIKEEADLSELSDKAQKLYNAAKTYSASTFQRLAVSNNSHGGALSTILTTLAKNGQVHNFADAYASFYGDYGALRRLQQNAPDVAAAIGKGQNTYNVSAVTRRYGLDSFATEVGNAQRDTQFAGHLSSLVNVDGVWGQVVTSQVQQPLIKLRAGSAMAERVHQFALSQPPVINTTTRAKIQRTIGKAARGAAKMASPSFGYQRDIDLNSLDSYHGFRANLERTGDLMTPIQREQWVSAYMAQPEAAQRGRVVAHVEDFLYREIGKRIGMTGDEVRVMMEAVKMRRAISQSMIKSSRAYWPTELRTEADKAARAGRVNDAEKLHEMAEAYEAAVKKGQLAGFFRRTLDDQGSLVIVDEDIKRAIFDDDTPIMASQNADFLPMTDFRMLRTAMRRYIAPSKRIAEAKRAKAEGVELGTYDPLAETIDKADVNSVRLYKAQQALAGMMEAVNRTWATIAVLRPAHTPRTLADDMLRRMIVHGEWQVFASAYQGLYRWGANRKAVTMARRQARADERVRKMATGDLDAVDVVQAAPAAPVPGQTRGKGAPKRINRFDGIALPPEMAEELAGRYSWTVDRSATATNTPALTVGNTTYFSTYEEALLSGNVSVDQFLGSIVHHYKDGTLPVDYMQILDSAGSKAIERTEAYRMIIDYALGREGLDAYKNAKMTTDVYSTLFDMQRSRTDVSERAQIVADPLSGAYGPAQRKIFTDYETAGFIDVKPDPDFMRIASDEVMSARTAKGRAAGARKPSDKRIAATAARADKARAAAEAARAVTDNARALIGDAEVRVVEAASTPARRAAETALRRVKRGVEKAEARQAAAEAKLADAELVRDEAAAGVAEFNRLQAEAAETASAAAMADAHQEMGNFAFGYDFEAPEKLFHQFRDQIITQGAKFGYTLRPGGEIRVSVIVPAGVDTKPVDEMTAAQKVANFSRLLEDSGKTRLRISEGDHTVVVDGGFHGPGGEAARSIVSARNPDETWAATRLSQVAETQFGKAIGRGAWKPTIRGTDAEYGPAWERAVNQELANDAVAKKFLAGWSEARVLDWVESGDGEARRWLNQNTMDRAYHDEQVAAIGSYVSHLVPVELRGKVLGQTATHGDLARLIPEASERPSVHGESLTMATGTNPAFQWMKKGVDKWFKWMVNKPTDKLVRFPFFNESYLRHADALSRAYLKDVKKGETWSQAEIDRLQQIARDKALFDVRRYLYDTAFRTDAADAFAKFMPFANAQADAIFKWARILKEKPVQTLSAASRWWLMPERMGLVQDQDGNQLVYEPSLEGRFERWIDPVTGEEVTGKKDVGKSRYVAFRLPTGLTPEQYKGRPATVRFNKMSANVFLSWPTAGPWVSIPFNEFVLKTDPTIGDNETVRQFLMPFGPQSDVLKSALPGLLRTAYESFVKDDTDSAYETMGYFAQQQVDAAYGLRREDPNIEEAHEMASTMKTIRFWSSAFAPVAIQYENPYATYVDYYKRLVAKHGGDKQLATDEFVSMAGDDAVALTYSITRNLGGIPATKESWQRYDQLEDLAKKFPEWAAMITGAEGSSSFSKGIYEAQKRAGLRAEFTTEDSAAEVHKRATWSQYAKMNDFIMTKLTERGLRSLNQSGAEDLAQFKAQWVENSKWWNGPNGGVEISPWFKDYYERSTTTMQRLTSAVQLVQDTRLQGRDEVRGLVEYLNMRQRYVGYLRANGFSTIKAVEAKPIRDAWDLELGELQEQKPSFATLHSYYLEADDLSFELNYQEILGQQRTTREALQQAYGG